MTTKDMYKYETDLYLEGFDIICGLDEAGRGPMAGPLVVAGVILKKGQVIEGVNDSKVLSSKKREYLYDIIMKDALEVKVKIFSPREVDRLNVYQASKKGMEWCVKEFKNKPSFCLTDAMPLDVDIPYLSIIKGDKKSASIAAASIIAKVTRDRIMEELDIKYPMYGFKKHKGYVTKMHLEMLNKYGVSSVHRKTFAPVKKIIEKSRNID